MPHQPERLGCISRDEASAATTRKRTPRPQRSAWRKQDVFHKCGFFTKPAHAQEPIESERQRRCAGCAQRDFNSRRHARRTRCAIRQQPESSRECGNGPDKFGEPERFIPRRFIETLECSLEIGEWLRHPRTVVRGVQRDDQRERARCWHTDCCSRNLRAFGIFGEGLPDYIVRRGAARHRAVQVDRYNTAFPLACVNWTVAIEVAVTGERSEIDARECCRGFGDLMRRHEEIRVDVAAQLRGTV